MPVDVVDVPFFHINSNANGSAHAIMRRGDVVEVGDLTNPFFRYYETYARTYPVRNPSGEVQPVSAIAFLAHVKDGAINPDNLPLAAWEISRHFLMLAREVVWENIRLQEFPSEPSRQRCIWLVESEEQARFWVQMMGFSPMTYSIVKVRATGHALNTDGRLLAADSEPLPVWYDKARRYWSGEMTEAPHVEILFAGTLRVEEIMAPSA